MKSRLFTLSVVIINTFWIMTVYGGSFRFTSNPVKKSCQELNCGATAKCIRAYTGFSCGILNGNPCTFTQLCEDGGQCYDRKICGNPLGASEGSTCKLNNCDKGLYCDLKEEKCRPITRQECSRNDHCIRKCPQTSAGICECLNGKCY